jgi:predicted Kef-type K+ transport protein
VSARTPRDELADATEHGGLYLRRLLRAQLTLSLLALVAFGGLVGGLPLALYLLPGLQQATLLGIPLPILAVMWPPFPLFVAIAVVYTRRAEALEEEFRELVEPPR